jgi:5-methylthioribose kinase
MSASLIEGVLHSGSVTRGSIKVARPEFARRALASHFLHTGAIEANPTHGLGTTACC